MAINKQNMLRIAVPVLAVIAMLIGAWLIISAFKPRHQQQTTQQPPIAVIEVTHDGFVPATLHVVPGTKVVWVNSDVAPHRIAADPYPSHSELPALVAPKALGQKQTYSFTFTKARTVHYHDELNPTLEASITVN
jgi:plastocyanin